MTTIFRKHWAAILLALFIGFAIAVPQLIAQSRMGSAYQGIHPLVSGTDDLYYLTRAHELIDGHPLLGNPFLAGHKNNPPQDMWIPDIVLAKVELILLGSLKSGFILWDALLPFLSALLSYAIIFFLTEDIPVSIATVAVLFFGLFLVPFNRTPYPQLFVLFLLPTYLFFRALRSNEWFWWLGASVAGGALFYVYPYFWTDWLVTVVLSACGFLLFLRDTKACKYFFLSLCGTFLIGIPYFIWEYQASKLPYHSELLERAGVIPTHFPSGITIALFAFFALALAYWCWHQRIIKRNSTNLLVIGSSLAGLIATNQHVITGLDPESASHYMVPAIFMSVIVTALCASALLDRYTASLSSNRQKILRWSLTVLCVVFSLASAAPFLVRAATPQPSDLAAQRYGPVLSWLDTHTKTDAVVYADPTLSLYIPAYTRDNVFFSFFISQTYLSQAEIDARYAGEHYLDPSFTETDLLAQEGQPVFGQYYISIYQHTMEENRVRKLLGLAPLTALLYPQPQTDDLFAQIQAARAGSFAAALGGYPVDYLVWDTVTDPDWRVDAVPGLTRLYSVNGIIVYAVKQ